MGLKVQPGARRSALAGLYGNRLKVALQAPPVDGKANEALVSFLAELAGVSRSAVRIVRGEKSREKTVLIAGVTAQAMTEVLRRHGVVPDTTG